jgi:ABC-type lipoprotein export system ATPase subunit
MLRLDSVSKYYRSNNVVSRGMYQVSLEFNIGEFVGITGESGSGKSTLLNVISGLDGYDEGEMYLYDNETSHYTVADFEKYRANYIGFIFQNYNIIDQYTVFQNVMLALEVQNYPIKERRSRAKELIESVGLKDRMHQKASKLSGGEKQRCVIARALAKDTPIICCDEPTGNLDSVSAKKIISLLHEISKEKLIIVVTHNYEEIESFATRKITMSDGQIIEDNKFRVSNESEVIAKKNMSKMRFLDIVKTSILNFFSQPKKASLQLLFLIFFLFIIILVYGNTINDSKTVSSDVDVLQDELVIIERQDGFDLTASDLSYFSSVKETISVYPDSSNFFFDNRLAYVELQIYDIYLMPGITLKNMYLTSGSKSPEKYDEIVLSIDLKNATKLEIGDKIKLRNQKDSTSIMPGIKSVNGAQDSYTFTIVGFENHKVSSFFVSEEFLNSNSKFTRRGVVTIEGDQVFDSFLSKIDQKTYKVRYNYRAEDVFSTLVGGVIIVIIVIPIILLSLIFFLIYSALSKNVMNSRKKDFAIMRSIGTTKMNLGMMIIIEQIFVCGLAYIFLMVVLVIFQNYLPSFHDLLRYIKPIEYVLIFIAVLLFGAYIGSRFNKKYFGYSVIEELTMSKED